MLGLSRTEQWVRCHPACHTDPDLEQSASLGSDRVFTSKIQLSTPSDICHVFVWRRRYLCMLASVIWYLVHSWNRGIIVNPHPPLRMPQSSQEAWHNCSTNDDHYRWTALQTLYSTSHAMYVFSLCYLSLVTKFRGGFVWSIYVCSSDLARWPHGKRHFHSCKQIVCFCGK